MKSQVIDHDPTPDAAEPVSANDVRRGRAARLAAISGRIWAMLPEAFDGLLLAAAATATEPQAKVPRLPAVKGGIAVLPIHGVIGQRIDWWADAGTDWLGRKLDELMADGSIGAIVLDIDSPGGTVYGTPELAEKIRGYRDGPKPIYAVADSVAFSAAYFLAAQATKLFVAPSGKVGSIGVWTAHVDASKFYDEAGIKITLVNAGRYKVEGHSLAPLADEARAEMQRDVDYYYELFLAAVAAGRGVKTADVKANYGQGRLIEAPRAVELGMADGIATLDEVLVGLLKNQRDSREKARAELDLLDARLAVRQRLEA